MMTDLHSGIVNSEIVISHFGYWPTFHDAEVLWIRLDRQASSLGDSPTLEASIHAFEMTSQIDESGHYVLQKHALIQFRFSRVVESKIDDFNHQNALYGLTIADIRDRQMEKINFDVRFAGTFGVTASFQAEQVEVVSVEPLDANSLPRLSPRSGAVQSRPNAN